MPPQRPSAARHWCFTINNPNISSDQLEQLLSNFQYVFQLESGANGTRHFQGYVVLPVKQRLTYLRRVISPIGHYEIANGSPEDNIRYCTKNEGRIEPPRIRGLVLPGENGGRRNGGRGRPSQLDAACTLLKEEGMAAVVEQFPGVYVRHFRGLEQLKLFWRRGRRLTEPPEVIWIYGPSGTGKSTIADMCEPNAYRKANGQWWDGYDDHDAVIWDDFSGRYPFRDLLVVLDKLGCNVEKKGSSCALMASKFIFTTNLPPWTFYNSQENTMDAFMRRITLFVHKISREESRFYLTREEAELNY